jgi:hypothetical protein
MFLEGIFNKKTLHRAANLMKNALAQTVQGKGGKKFVRQKAFRAVLRPFFFSA